MRAQLKWFSVDWKKVQKHICGEAKKSEKEKFQIFEILEKKLSFEILKKKLKFEILEKKLDLIIF